MTGFLTDTKTAAAITAAVARGCDERGVPRYHFANFFPVHSGPNAGMMFMGLSDADLQTVTHHDLRLADLPEFQKMIADMGGLKARAEIKPEELVLDSKDATQVKAASALLAACALEVAKLPPPITRWPTKRITT
jgi:hypothetical protein